MNLGISENDVIQNRFTAYLIVALKHSRGKYIQNRKRQLENETLFDPLQEPVILAVDNFDATLSAIHQLENTRLMELLVAAPPQAREILILKAINNLTFAQIAAKLGLHHKKVSAIYYRFINKLKEKMEDNLK